MRKNNIIRVMGLSGLALGVVGCDESAPSPIMPPTSACPADVGYDVACEPDGWECPPTAAQQEWDCEPEYWSCGDGKWQYNRSMTCNPPEVLPLEPEAPDPASPAAPDPANPAAPAPPVEAAAAPGGDAPAGEDAAQ